MSPNIVIVEDDSSVSKAIVRLLGVAGFQAVAFGSAEAFLESVTGRQFDCLILDINLPGLSGLELYDQVVTDAGVPVPVIFITAHDKSAARVKMDRDGTVTCLSKPFHARTLIGAVRKNLAIAHSA
jgi:FixJ family two-component response regulator